MKLSKADLVYIALLLVAFGVTVAVYGQLPEAFPTHFNGKGVADRFTPKPFGPFFMPLTIAVLFIVKLASPRISPEGFRMDSFARAHDIFHLTLAAFLLMTHSLILGQAMGFRVPFIPLTFAGLGVLLMVMGNFFGKLTKNFFFGIRTPWTLAHEEVWLKTHRFAGKAFVFGGAVLFLGSLFASRFSSLLFLALLPLVFAYPYSYWVYRRVQAGANLKDSRVSK